jgi:prefoldin subunit 5
MTEESNVEYLTINNTKHDVSQMDDQQRYYISQLKVLNQDANNLRANLDRVQRSINSFQSDLIASVEGSEPEVAEAIN